MRHELLIPEKMKPRVDEKDPCPCQFKPVLLMYKKTKIFWKKKVGDHVSEGETVAEGEVEKKILEFKAPVSGILEEILVPEGEEVKGGIVLGYINDEM